MTLYRFDQIAENINVRVMPSDTELDRYVGLEHLDPESLKIRRWGSPADVIGQKLRFWEGDIIYGRRRAYQRKVAVADFEGICSAHAMVLRAKPDVCLPEFLPFFLQSELFHQRALEISVGSLSPTINWTTLAGQEFPLPPLDEQRRIAVLLWAADEAIQGLRFLADKTKNLLKSLQENQLLDNSPEAEPLKVRLDSLFLINPSEPLLSADSPFIAMESVDEWKREIARWDSKGSRGGIRARAGDVLLARITPSLENGKTAIVPVTISRCGGSTEFIVIRGKKGISSDLAYWIVTSDSVRRFAIGLMHGSTGRQRVSATDFAGIRVKLADNPDLNETVQTLNDVYSTNQIVMACIEHTMKLKKELLEKSLELLG